jgi:hypothetical protein
MALAFTISALIVVGVIYFANGRAMLCPARSACVVFLGACCCDVGYIVGLDEKFREVDLLLYTNDNDSVMHYGLQGCATDMVPVTSDALVKNSQYIQDGMGAKILWGEVDRMSEPEILKRVKEIAEVRGTVTDNIPKLLWHQ